MIRVYHGSNVIVERPNTQYSRDNVDFGKGFYVTPIPNQAKNWAAKFKRRGQEAIVSVYAFNDRAYQERKTKIFDTYSEEWLDFVLNCRNKTDHSDYEIVVGGVANDKVFNTVELYFDGLIDKAEALKRLRYERPNLQICLRTQPVIDQYLLYEGSKVL